MKLGMKPIHEEEEKVQNKNLQNYSKISTPHNIRLTHVGVVGVTFTGFPISLSKYCSMQKWPVFGSSFDWLI